MPASSRIVLDPGGGVRRPSRLSQTDAHLLGQRPDTGFFKQPDMHAWDHAMGCLRGKPGPGVLNFAAPHLVHIAGRPDKPDLAGIGFWHIVIFRALVRIPGIARQKRARQRQPARQENTKRDSPTEDVQPVQHTPQQVGELLDDI